eukprot:TRINITY_DN71154_c0_g1_i1.p1 TRINITY_DN71154_c0_g1~~TRINITY_DN71154_c0_g1_i1.p1  ORF type:complete len:714 (+),score=31.21 TRINITY_DN71154_c0_g1_i1:128-2143(+)
MRLIVLPILLVLLALSRTQNTTGKMYQILTEYPKGSIECTEKVQYIINSLFTDPSVTSFLSYSGKGLNDLGDYKNCIRKEASRYILLQIYGLPANVAMGFCVPKECKENDYTGLKEHIASVMTKAFAADKKTPLERNLTKNEVVFTDPIQRKSARNFFTRGFYWSVLYLALFVTLTIAATVVSSDEKEQTVLKSALSCFDFTKNVKAIFTIPQGRDQDLAIFNGIRVISMLWVILGHTFYYTRHGYVTNILDLPEFLTTFWNSYILSGPFSVDVFFFLSGFLATYLAVKQGNGKGTFIQTYVHRLLRIFPLYVLTMVLYMFILPLLGDGPGFFNFYHEVDHNCSKYWMYNLLFLNNFVPHNHECMGYTWYLANDMQFFILTPLLVYLYLKRRSLGYYAVIFLGLTCTTIGIALSIKYNLSASYMKFTEDYFERYYQRPYNRISPYLVGILAAYGYHEYKKGYNTWFTKFTEALKSSTILRWGVCFISFTIMFWLVHAIYWLNKYPESWEGWPDVLYLLLSKPLFVLCLFALLYPAMINRGRLMQAIFGHPLFIPLARTTFGAYLFHPMLMIYMSMNEKKGVYFEQETLLIKFVGFAVISYAMSIVMTAMFESPISRLDKLRSASKTEGERKGVNPKELHTKEEWDRTAIQDEDVETLNSEKEVTSTVQTMI